VICTKALNRYLYIWKPLMPPGRIPVGVRYGTPVTSLSLLITGGFSQCFGKLFLQAAPLQVIKMEFFFITILLFLVPIAAGRPLIVEERATSDTANEFTKGGCRANIFIFARGSTEDGNLVSSHRNQSSKVPAVTILTNRREIQWGHDCLMA
jgi:hypothetical protein